MAEIRIIQIIDAICVRSLAEDTSFRRNKIHALLSHYTLHIDGIPPSFLNKRTRSLGKRSNGIVESEVSLTDP
jgi:hypothetical protein